MDKIEFYIVEDEMGSWYDVDTSPGGYHVCSCCTKKMAQTIVEALETLCRTKEISPAEFRKNWQPD